MGFIFKDAFLFITSARPSVEQSSISFHLHPASTVASNLDDGNNNTLTAENLNSSPTPANGHHHQTVSASAPPAPVQTVTSAHTTLDTSSMSDNYHVADKTVISATAAGLAATPSSTTMTPLEQQQQQQQHQTPTTRKPSSASVLTYSINNNNTSRMSAISSADFQPMTTVTPLGLCQPSPLSSSLSCTSPPAHTFNLHVLTTGTGGSHKIARDSLIHSSKDVFQFDDVDSVKTTHSFFRRLSPSSSTQSDSTQRSSSVVAPPPAHVNTIHGNANGTTNTITIVSNSNSSGSSSHTKEQHKSNNKKSKSNGKPPNANVANASGSKKKKFLNAKQSISNLITPIFRGTGGHAGKPVSPLVITPLANALSSSNILIDSRCITKLPDQRITRDAPSVASASAVEAAAAAASADSGSLQRSSTFTRHLNRQRYHIERENRDK